MSCPKRVARVTAPLGFTVGAQATHPTYRYYLEPGAACELGAGHAGPHRSGLLVWHDPPLVVLERDRAAV